MTDTEAKVETQVKEATAEKQEGEKAVESKRYKFNQTEIVKKKNKKKIKNDKIK